MMGEGYYEELIDFSELRQILHSILQEAEESPAGSSTDVSDEVSIQRAPDLRMMYMSSSLEPLEEESSRGTTT